MTPALPGLPRRIGACVYDGLLLLAVLMLATLPWVLTRDNGVNDDLNFAPLGPSYQIYLLLIVYGYFALGWCKGGQTLGMKSWRIRLISISGDTVTPRQALFRLIAALFAWLPAAAGIFWQYFDTDGLTWHDRASQTRVVQLKKHESSVPD